MIVIHGGKKAGRYFTPALAQAIKRDGDEAARKNGVGKLDGDPFINAQFADVHDLKIAITGDDKKATATVTFINSGQPQLIVLDLLPTPAGWRVDDIHGSVLSSVREKSR